MATFPNLEINPNAFVMIKRKKSQPFKFNLLVFALFLFGCGDSGEVTEKAKLESTTKGTIGVSVLTLGNPFFSVIADNVTSEAAKYGYEVVVVDGDRDVRKQANQIDDFLTKGVSAIILNPCDRISIGTAIKKANDAGVPVFTCDLKCVADGAEVVSHVGSDNLQGGRLAGEAMIEALGEQGGKVLVIHFPQANSCQLRVQGFEEVLGAYNDGLVAGRIEIVAELDGGGVRDEGYKVTEDTLQAHPDLAGIFAINDPSGLGARAALEKARSKIRSRSWPSMDNPKENRQLKMGRSSQTRSNFPIRSEKRPWN